MEGLGADISGELHDVLYFIDIAPRDRRIDLELDAGFAEKVDPAQRLVKGTGDSPEPVVGFGACSRRGIC